MMENGYRPLTGYGLIAFEGADARTFLNSQLTCDVAGLADDAWTYGAYCTPKGRVLASFLLWPTSTGYLMQVPLALREPLQKRLGMYILRSKVKASDATAVYAQYGIAGPEAPALVERIVGVAPGALHKVAQSGRGMAASLPPGRYLVAVPRDQDTAATEVLREASHQEGETWWERLDIAAGIASVVPETQEQFVPQMLNLDAVGGVSFSKGCYPGQEIVARMHYLGRLKERMFRARVAAARTPRPGDRLYGVDLGTQAAGMIVNAVPASGGEYDVLAVIRLSSVAAGPVRLDADGPALVIEKLPYALPAR